MSLDTFLDLRQMKGVSQKELGEIAGVSRDSISLYEKGKRMPSAGVLLDLAEYFGIPPRRLYQILSMEQED